MAISQSEIHNRLLRGLTGDDYRCLQPSLVAVNLPVRKILHKQRQKIDAVYFLDTGIASFVTGVSKTHSIEVGICGVEGMTGMALILGSDQSPNDTFMQAAGNGWSLSAAALKDAMASVPGLRSRLLLYCHVMTVQMS